jgi:hypothetical protein
VEKSGEEIELAFDYAYASFLLFCPGEAAKTSVTFIIPTLFI